MKNTIDYCLSGEDWKDISGYEGIYQASTFGRIRTVDGKTTHTEKHGIRKWSGRIMKSRGSNPVTGNRVTLWKNKISKEFLVARLIGFTFLGTPKDSKMTINHIDGNRFNNRLENLEWLSLADNIRHAFANDLMPSKSVSIKVIEETYSFHSLTEASKYIGRNRGYISNLLKHSTRGTTVDGLLFEVVQGVS